MSKVTSVRDLWSMSTSQLSALAAHLDRPGTFDESISFHLLDTRLRAAQGSLRAAWKTFDNLGWKFPEEYRRGAAFEQVAHGLDLLRPIDATLSSGLGTSRYESVIANARHSIDRALDHLRVDTHESQAAGVEDLRTAMQTIGRARSAARTEEIDARSRMLRDIIVGIPLTSPTRYSIASITPERIDAAMSDAARTSRVVDRREAIRILQR